MLANQDLTKDALHKCICIGTVFAESIVAPEMPKANLVVMRIQVNYSGPNVNDYLRENAEH